MIEILVLVTVLVLLYLRFHAPLIITYQLVDDRAMRPTRAYARAACFDVYAVDDVTIPVGEWREVSTGIKFAPWPHIYIPILGTTLTPLGNVAGRIFTRSGHARKKGLRAHLGVIDNDFRDVWSIIMYNHNSKNPVRIKAGERVAQIEFYRVPQTWMVRTRKLTKSLRGTNKFGSSGN